MNGVGRPQARCRQQAQSVVEFALSLPLLMTLLLGGLNAGLLLTDQVIANYASRQGARLAAEMGGYQTNPWATTTQIDTAIVRNVLAATRSLVFASVQEIDIYSPQNPNGVFNPATDPYDSFDGQGNPLVQTFDISWRNQVPPGETSIGVRVVYQFNPSLRFFFAGLTLATHTVMKVSPVDATIVASTHLESRPTAPTSVTACPGDTFATVGWSPAISPNGVSQYMVTASPGARSVTVSGLALLATVPGLQNGTSYIFTVRAANGYGWGPASAFTNAVTPAPGPGSWPSRFHPLSPVRVLDTRIGLGAPQQQLGPGQTLSLSLLGRGGLPNSGVSAVVLNLTAANASQVSYLAAAAQGSCTLGFSNLNFGPGTQRANLVLVPLGSGGRVSIYNSQGYVDVIADLFGYVGSNSDTGPDGHLRPLGPTRILDTRLRTQGIGTLGPNQRVRFQVLGQQGLPASGYSAVLLNLTATNPTQGSYFQLWPDDQPQPLTSNVNFGPGETIANRVMVPLGADGGLYLYNSQGYADAIVDVVGLFTNSSQNLSSGLYTGLVPVRILDTRIGLGAPQRQLGPGQWLTLKVAGSPGLPSSSRVVLLNLTATNPSQASYLQVNSTGLWSGTSDLNFRAGWTIANLTPVQLDPQGQIHIYNSQGYTDVIVDLLGAYN